mmetsp:Transcript_32418/g.59636  ORF Transcript_32418/g.59636 Transcript_32418/m.59636 type:complete len:121 (+) Transcript_32418:208-570(+)
MHKKVTHDDDSKEQKGAPEERHTDLDYYVRVAKAVPPEGKDVQEYSRHFHEQQCDCRKCEKTVPHDKDCEAEEDNVVYRIRRIVQRMNKPNDEVKEDVTKKNVSRVCSHRLLRHPFILHG